MLQHKTLAAAAGLLGAHASSADMIAASSTDVDAIGGASPQADEARPFADPRQRLSLDTQWLRDWR